MEHSAADDSSESERPTAIPRECLGEAETTVDVDERTYARLRDRYEELVGAGRDVDFAAFVENYCQTSTRITVDGEPVEVAYGD